MKTYVRSGALSAKTLDLSVTINLVVLEDSQLGLLALVLDLLGGGVDLLLALLGTTTETEDEVKSGLLLDVVVGEGAAVLELLAGEDQALLVRGNAFLVLDLGLDIVDGVGGLDLKGDGLTRDCEDVRKLLKHQREAAKRERERTKNVRVLTKICIVTAWTTLIVFLNSLVYRGG